MYQYQVFPIKGSTTRDSNSDIRERIRILQGFFQKKLHKEAMHTVNCFLVELPSILVDTTGSILPQLFCKWLPKMRLFKKKSATSKQIIQNACFTHKYIYRCVLKSNIL
jgi:hypothetical protein